MGESVAAAFSSVTVYEARGIALATGTTHVTAGTVANVAYRLAASPSVNEGCLALLNDTFTDNEEEWRVEKVPKPIRISSSWANRRAHAAMVD